MNYNKSCTGKDFIFNHNGFENSLNFKIYATWVGVNIYKGNKIIFGIISVEK